ncbi:S8 family serine peptidase [Bdellovibrio sp. SKB1291214]|uniref:S8 family serine peptidase n=1 Tax=Bdellovibrio sp. SKB1291214 TaxID=1732569 RepID=UPI002240C175|nr:S8 family serine peptidase [Bdellovibrio sp. SKB1291214]UYL07726.1 S8 family serine peptidase [Bdellovibrio sp. SKB1291214]
MQKWTRLFVTSALVASATSPVYAGSLLRFNSGTVNPGLQSQALTFSENVASDYIVQFSNKITAKDRSALQARFEVFGYLPDDALVVRGTWADLNSFRQSHPGIYAVAKYQAQYKISNDIAPVSVFNKDQTQSILIQLFKAADSKQVVAALKNMKADLQVVSGKSIVALVPRAQIYNVAGLTGVEHVQATPEIQTMDFPLDHRMDPVIKGAGDYSDLTGDESGTQVMKFDSAWKLGLTGKGQTVSMADTGLDSGSTTAIASDFSGAVKSGYAFGLWAKTWEDPMGHGTHVAGSIMSRGTASGGRLKGGAYDAMMVAEGMWSPMLNGLSVPSKLADLFDKANNDGARVHSNSWGAVKNFGAYDAMAVQVDEWMNNNPDMLVVFAAGNSGVDMNKDGRIDAGSIGTPGTAKNVLTVGASKNKTKTGGIQVPVSKLRAAAEAWSAEPIFSSMLSDRDDGIAMFSSRGPTLDGRVKPEIVAPGTNILSNRSHIKNASPLWGAYNDDYAWSGGTSMATPLTSGAVAVARQMLVEKWGVQNPSAAALKAMIMHSADDLYPGQFGEIGAAKGQELLTRRPNSDEGYGRVNMDNMVQMMKNTFVADNRDGLATNQEETYQFKLDSSGKLYANLVWTDAPGSANASKALVNDLDLVLVGPNGTVSMNDHINNNEMIEQVLPAGDYKLIVKGANVPNGKNGGRQAYALVWSVQ